MAERGEDVVHDAPGGGGVVDVVRDDPGKVERARDGEEAAHEPALLGEVVVPHLDATSLSLKYV